MLVFFFQAEDGIRVYKVTGVQTCALPISIGLGDAQFATGRFGLGAVAGGDSCDLAPFAVLHGGNDFNGGDPGDAEDAPTDFLHGLSILPVGQALSPANARQSTRRLPGPESTP